MCDIYTTSRNQYKPDVVKILFIGEARPLNDRFFYNQNSNLHNYTRMAIDEKYGQGQFSLESFMGNGCWLYDVCDIPANGMPEAIRMQHINNGIDALLKIIFELKPEIIIVVKRGSMREILLSPISQLGYLENSNLHFLPFPACGNQNRYKNKLIEIFGNVNLEWTNMDLKKQIIGLSKTRKIFHSEADFQFALAWQIQKAYPNAEVRLEYCPSGTDKVMHIDILVIIDGNWFPIELKYKTLKCTKIWNEEKFNLKSHGAQDLGRYDFLNDVKRIEYLSKALPKFKEGFSVLLTNDSSYWKTPNRVNNVYHEFRLCEDVIKTGIMCWAEHAGKGTVKGREESINLGKTYCAKWVIYSKIDDLNSGEFKYLIF